jgi:histidinol-phosphate aminotransferase
MSSRSILVRDRSSDPGCEGCVRITIATDQQMDGLLAALDETFRAMLTAERSLA